MSCGSHAFNPKNPVDLASSFGDAALLPRLTKVWAGCARRFEKWRRLQISIDFEKVRQRRILLELDDRLLRDIGLTREQAEREARKPFWK